MPPQSTCSIDGCERNTRSRGWCSVHYSRWVHHSDPLGGGGYQPHEATIEDRFLSRLDHSLGILDCWIWGGAITKSGYGHMWAEGREIGAHRVAYSLVVGPIPDGLTIDHLCRVRSCVNPFHLEPVSSSENTRRGDVGKYIAARTHCRLGHPYSPINTGGKSRLKRHCLECKRASGRATAARRRAKMVDYLQSVRCERHQETTEVARREKVQQ